MTAEPGTIASSPESTSPRTLRIVDLVRPHSENADHRAGGRRVKKAVMTAVASSGENILHDKDVKRTMKQVVKKAAKEAVKEAVKDAQDAEDIQEAKADKAAKSRP